MLKALSRLWRVKRRARRRFLLSSLFASPILLAVGALVLWALLEPTSSQVHRSYIRCTYAEQQQHGARANGAQALLCEQADPGAPEYQGYREAKEGDPAAFVGAVRHWLARALADPVALFTLVLAVSTILLWLYTRGLLRIGERQSLFQGRELDVLGNQQGLANAQYFADHRPRIVIKNVFVTDLPQMLSIDIANTGSTGATIVDSWFCLTFTEREIDFRNMTPGALEDIDGMFFSGAAVEPIARRLPSDVSDFVGNANFEERFEGAGRFRQTPDPAGTLSFFGAIRYVDERGKEFGITRLSVFRREWDGVSRSFKRTGNPDHEYAD